jgi:hypothetical protein
MSSSLLQLSTTNTDHAMRNSWLPGNAHVQPQVTHLETALSVAILHYF